MPYAKSLRVIGQSLEVAKLPAFELEMDGSNYVVTSDSLTQTGEWILRHALSPNDISEESTRQSPVSRPVRFGPADLSRLDDQAQKQRRNDSAPPCGHSGIISTKLRQAPFIFPGHLIRFPSISSHRTVKAIRERLPLTSSSNWVRI